MNKNHAHPSLVLVDDVAVVVRPLPDWVVPAPEPLPRVLPPETLYRLLAVTEMMSWLSLSSPVSADRPR